MMEYTYQLNTRSGVKTIETDCPTSYFKPILDCVEKLPNGDIVRLFELVRGIGFNIEYYEHTIDVKYDVRF